MQYVMLVRVDEELAATEAGEDVTPWVEEGVRTGVRIDGRPLEDPSTATTVRVRGGSVLISDGPFVETKEIVAGYDLLEEPDLEAAIDYASRHPVAAFGALELREVWPDFVADAPEPLPEPRAEGADYLFLHVPDPELLKTATRATGDPTDWVRDVEQRRVTLGGFRLRDADAGTSATVRRRSGETLVTRGPYAEIAEQIAGIDRVRVPDLDEALELAGAHPTSHLGVIEVRPFQAL
jgi:hypothetical protein